MTFSRSLITRFLKHVLCLPFFIQLRHHPPRPETICNPWTDLSLLKSKACCPTIIMTGDTDSDHCYTSTYCKHTRTRETTPGWQMLSEICSLKACVLQNDRTRTCNKYPQNRWHLNHFNSREWLSTLWHHLNWLTFALKDIQLYYNFNGRNIEAC